MDHESLHFGSEGRIVLELVDLVMDLERRTAMGPPGLLRCEEREPLRQPYLR